MRLLASDETPLLPRENEQAVSNEVFEIIAEATYPGATDPRRLLLEPPISRRSDAASRRRPFKIGAALLGLGLAACVCIRKAFPGTQIWTGNAWARGQGPEMSSEVHTFQLPTHAPPQVHTFELPHLPHTEVHTFEPEKAEHSFVPKKALHTFDFKTPTHTFDTHVKPKISTFVSPAEPKADKLDQKESSYKSDKQLLSDTTVGAQKRNGKLPWWKKNARPGEAWPSLFCWMHAEETELDLVRSQLVGKFGIFNCNEFAVVTRQGKAVDLGPHPTKANTSVLTWPNPMAPDVKGNPQFGDQTDSWKNANTFRAAWGSLIDSGGMWKHDWIVKIDPDTVFFPDRLRRHIMNKTRPPEGPGEFYLLNCFFGEGRIYGSIEVYSVRAVLGFKANGSKCDSLDASTMGEDLFMEQCMRILYGSKNAVKDFKLVGDDHCTKAGCEDKWRVGFHPFPKVVDYWNCANTAVEAAKPAKAAKLKMK